VRVRLLVSCLWACAAFPVASPAAPSADEAQAGAALRVPVRLFAGEPRGAHRTGTFEELWIDEARGEATTSNPDDARHLMVQVWYPAAFAEDPPRAPYALSRNLYPKDEGSRWLDDAAEVRTNSVLNAPLAPAAAPFPVLIYNPGGYHPPFSATFQTEFLASHGYVVVAIGHTGLTRIERFPDGYVYRPDANPAFISEEEGKGLAPVEYLRLQLQRFSQQMMPVHVQDIRFALDRLERMNATRGGRFHRRLDLGRVGSLGWSLGGALSMQASRDEPRIKAAINLDGWLFTDAVETGTHRPVLQMHGALDFSPAEGFAAEKERSSVAEARLWRFYSKTGSDWFNVTLQRAGHGHFSDRTLFEPVEEGQMHPRLAHDIVNRYTLEFFDRYLRGATETPLLAGRVSYPEVELVKQPR
jgi:predicted dienelactone hydrolase